MFIANVLLYCNLHILSGRGPSKRLSSYAEGTVLWTLLLFLYTEVLSCLQLLSRLPLLFTWLATDCVLLLLLFLQKRKKQLSRKTFLPGSPLDKKYLLPICMGICVTALALYTVPYNWDSMTYHLSRITHWAQNSSVAHYATNSIRQISSPVLGEFVNLHVYLLQGGSDRLFLLLQCASYLTGAVLLHGIAKKLGCRDIFRYLTVLLYMSMPIALAEALTTQVDNFATLWLLIFVYLLLDLTDPSLPLHWDRGTISRVCFLGLCAAFGYLTKPSVCVAMVVFALWLLIVCIRRRDNPAILIRLIGCGLPCTVLPILPELLRNLKTFHAVSSSIAGQRQLVGTLHPLYLFINFLKNFLFNLPTTLLYNINSYLYRLTTILSSLLHVSMDDPSISEDGRAFALHTAPNYAHDTAINPLIVWLFLIVIFWGLLRVKKGGLRQLLHGYSGAAAISFLLFCVVLRWEPYVTRYMVSYLALLCPMLALQLQNFTEQKAARAAGIIGAVGLLCLTSFISMGIYHREMCVKYGASSRPYGYFTNRSNEYSYYEAICQDIRAAGYTQLGLHTAEDSYEYPLWRMLDGQSERLEHVLVSNESEIYEDTGYIPECIIWIDSAPPEGGLTYNGQVYDRIIDYGEAHYLLLPQ